MKKGSKKDGGAIFFQFFCLIDCADKGITKTETNHFSHGIIYTRNGERPADTLNRVCLFGAKTCQCRKDQVFIVSFNKIN